MHDLQHPSRFVHGHRHEQNRRIASQTNELMQTAQNSFTHAIINRFQIHRDDQHLPQRFLDRRQLVLTFPPQGTLKLTSLLQTYEVSNKWFPTQAIPNL
jgi:hypothetical protein